LCVGVAHTHTDTHSTIYIYTHTHTRQEFPKVCVCCMPRNKRTGVDETACKKILYLLRFAHAARKERSAQRREEHEERERERVRIGVCDDVVVGGGSERASNGQWVQSVQFTHTHTPTKQPMSNAKVCVCVWAAVLATL